MQGVKQITYRGQQWLWLAVFSVGTMTALPIFVYASVFSTFFQNAQAETFEKVEYPQDSNMQMVSLLHAAINSDPNPAKGGGDILVDNGALRPMGGNLGKADSENSKTANGEINAYVVREGDTLSQIASMFDVSEKTILWANDLQNGNKIRPGDTLIILPITGVRHVVKKGDSLKSIAKKYSGDVDDIIAYNQLSGSQDLTVGDTIVIPDGTIAVQAEAKSVSSKRSKGTTIVTGAGSANFSNPLPGSIKTQGIHGYNGVDLSGVPVGTPVLAAAAGQVILAKSSGYNGGYGSYVVVKHPNGTQTLYAHLSSVAVQVGATVGKGQKLGGMGNTGRSTGPHLHFEVRGARNPF